MYILKEIDLSDGIHLFYIFISEIISLKIHEISEGIKFNIKNSKTEVIHGRIRKNVTGRVTFVR